MVIDTELHARTMRAVHAARHLIQDYLSSDAFVPGTHLPTVTTQKSGWPQITTDRWNDSTRIDQPEDLFGTKKDQFRPFAWEDVPELQELIDYVLSRNDLHARLRVEGHGEWADGFTTMWAADLPLSIVGRAHAVGVEDDADLTDLYETRERAWLAETLPIEFVIPLIRTPIDIEGSVALSNTVRVEHLTEADHIERGRHFWAGHGVPESLQAEATHALVITGADIRNGGPGPRFMDPGFRELDLTLVDAACEALRIVTLANVGYAAILRRPLGWADSWTGVLPVLEPIETLRRYAPRHDRRGSSQAPTVYITEDSLHRASGVLDAITKGKPRLKLAARRLSQADNRDDEDDRTVDACIGFEALLSDSSGELTHRLSQRAAAVLATRADKPANPHTIYKLMKKIYDHRSKVVHGSLPDKVRHIEHGDKKFRTGDLACLILRQLLLEAVERPGGWDPQSLDELILEQLKSPSGPHDH